MNPGDRVERVELSSFKFLAGCAVLSFFVFLTGRFFTFPAWVVALEILLTVASLFIFGSIRWRLNKNALTYGSALLIAATFWWIWWPASSARARVGIEGTWAFVEFLVRHLLSLRGLDEMIHADTLLFILGLTLFVSAIAQTRLLESISFSILRKSGGNVAWTLALIIALVAVASGVLGGVSMLGLMIRAMIIILFLLKIRDKTVIYAVMVSTVVTTVCGMWLTYGEPPNLIMKANLHPLLNDAFFLRYCLPAAVGSYLIVIWNLRKRLAGRRVNLETLDILEVRSADVRFLQAERHGKVLTALEFVEERRSAFGPHAEPLLKRLHDGMSLGEALARENVPRQERLRLMGMFISEDMACALDQYYQCLVHDNLDQARRAVAEISNVLGSVSRERRRAQRVGVLSFAPFIGFLIWHAMGREIPLFWASFAGATVAFAGIFPWPNIRRLAFREARSESAEYLFLIPLFFSITLLQKTGFFESFSGFIRHGVETAGVSLMALAQLAGAVFLSAVLDNNVVADFASRAIRDLDVCLTQVFAMAQIAGYAVGGCWTHIGSAQSVVAYAFIRKEIDHSFTPFDWIRLITPMIVEIFVLTAAIVFIESRLL